MSTIRPKPWESSDAKVSNNPQMGAEITNAPSERESKPPRPSEPVVISEPQNSGALATKSAQTGVSTGLGTTPAGFGGSGAYNSYGNYGSGYGTGYGGYSSGLGGYGSGYSSGLGGGLSGYGGYGGMGGYNGYGMGGYNGYGGMMNGMNGINGGPLGPLQNSTMATFQLIESMVGAFGGFAQMLESTYMATHSSFFAMMSVADQFGRLKQSLGSILGIFTVLRWSRTLIAKLTGRRPSARETSRTMGLTKSQFTKFQSANGISRPPRPSFKPLLFFLAAVFGFPYLLGKLIRNLAEQQRVGGHDVVDGSEPLDPSKLEFCRATYDFVPENLQVEVELKRGDLVAVLNNQDPMGNPSQWWRIRTRDGRTGYVPSTYLQLIPKSVDRKSAVAPSTGPVADQKGTLPAKRIHEASLPAAGPYYD